METQLHDNPLQMKLWMGSDGMENRQLLTDEILFYTHNMTHSYVLYNVRLPFNLQCLQLHYEIEKRINKSCTPLHTVEYCTLTILLIILLYTFSLI